jgi:hypothetical protein
MASDYHLWYLQTFLYIIYLGKVGDFPGCSDPLPLFNKKKNSYHDIIDIKLITWEPKIAKISHTKIKQPSFGEKKGQN